MLLGFHFCYGDLAHRHLVEPADLSLSVRMANLAISSAKRSIAWVHMPVPINRSDDAYFAPLRELKSGDAKAFQQRAKNAGFTLSAPRSDRFTVYVNETWAKASHQDILARLS